MNTPRLLLFGLFLPPNTYLPSREQNVHPEVFFFECRASLGNHGYIPVSKPRSFFALLTDVVIGLYSWMSLITCPFFYLMRHIELIIPSPRAIKNIFFLYYYKFISQKVIKKSINQSITLFMSIRGADGVAPIIRAEGSCMEHMTKHMMDFLYFSFPLTNNFSNHHGWKRNGDH